MIDPRNSQSVVEALGQAPMDAIGTAVASTSVDLDTYRRTLPSMSARPTREIYVGETFRLRFKKHAAKDMVSSFPTQEYLSFVEQDPPQLIQEVRLIGGYRWDPEAKEIGAPVLSARDGRSAVLWVVELAQSGGEGVVTHFRPRPGGPALPGLPKIVTPMDIEAGRGGEER